MPETKSETNLKEVPVQIAQKKLNTYYRVIKIDLSTQHVQTEIKLKRVYCEITIIRAPSALEIIIEPSSGPIPIAANQTLTIEDFLIKDRITYSNAAGAGTGIIWLAGYEELEELGGEK